MNAEFFGKYVNDAKSLPVSIDEMLRYVGYIKSLVTNEDREMAEKVALEAVLHIVPKACYLRFPVNVYGDGNIDLPYGKIYSEKLTKNLMGCNEIFIFAATLGADFDRYLKRAYLGNMPKAAFIQGYGAAAVEGLCDELTGFLDEVLSKENKKLRPRFSPGFGDYPLENQKGIFSVLRPEKLLGLTLMDTLIMAPEKSVTAIIGIEQI